MVIEAGETYIDGKAWNKAFGPPPKKAAVLTVVARDGEARSKHIAEVTAKALRETIYTTAKLCGALPALTRRWRRSRTRRQS